MKAKCLTLTELEQWRSSVAEADGTVAMVLGSFAMLQPGNLRAIEEAKKRASHVFVAAVREGSVFDRNSRPDAPSRRAELAAFLKNVSASYVLSDSLGSETARLLSPYILVDCLAQQQSSSLREVMRDSASEIIDIPPLAGCFTADIAEAVSSGRTPVRIPDSFAIEKRSVLQEIDYLRRGTRKLVTVNGCFDILHIGHAQMLAAARRLGDDLIVLVNDDESVRAYKGEGRPVFPIDFRLQALAALRPVTAAIPFSGDNPLALLARIRPEIHVKGGSYEEDRVRSESELLETWGGSVVFCPLVHGYSTTRLINDAGEALT